jgi:hypothetical protein
MKKTFLLLSLCILISFSLPVLAQNDSSRTNPTTKVLSDSIQSDTITIGNMLIIKKKVEQNYNENKSRGTIAIGNVVIGKWSNDQNENNTSRNRKKFSPYKTTIDFADKKVSFDISQSVNEDTVRLGRLQIIKSQDSNYKKDWVSMIEEGDFDNTKITIKRIPRKLKNTETNWWTFDLGFANFIDKSPTLYWLAANPNSLPFYPGPVMSPENFSLNNKKSTNVNVWVVTQKINLYQHKINFKYGLGLEMFNFRFDKSISFREDIATNVKYDIVSFTKNKLLVKYLTIPLQFNFAPNPTNRKAFYASIGMSAGYLWNAKNKQISGERGKEKFRGNFNLNDWRIATIGEIGVGSVRLYGSFANSNLFNNNQSFIDMQPFAVGLRFSRL